MWQSSLSNWRENVFLEYLLFHSLIHVPVQHSIYLEECCQESKQDALHHVAFQILFFQDFNFHVMESMLKKDIANSGDSSIRVFVVSFWILAESCSCCFR
mmetsp:Transcript_7107/g.14829  ORF Transcript_7107/g.14829 Transcript_7107/m.14829 type:complete len:100 (-) Transcript_7107:425-724(-)